MAQNIKPAAQKPEDPTVPKKSSKKLLIGAIASVVLIIAAAAGWYFTREKDHTAHIDEVKAAPAKAPIFVALEPFTVNLQRETSDQYLQLGITLKLFEAEVEAKIKENLPEIRSRILQLLTTKTATELLTAEGKTKLVTEITALSNSVIGIANAPARPVILAHAPAEQSVAASQVSESVAEAAHAQVAEAAPLAVPPPTPQHEAKNPVEKKGVVDVLFTSFIVQ